MEKNKVIKPILILLAISAVTALVFIEDARQERVAEIQRVADSIQAAEQAAADSIRQAEQAAADKQKRAEYEREFTELKNRFDYQKDDFAENGWYYHKDIPGEYELRNITLTRSTYIDTPVNETGYTYLISRYRESDWVFHTQIIALIDGQTHQTESIPKYDDSNITSTQGRGVSEIVHFSGGRDNGLVGILAATNASEVQIRYAGRQDRHDITLNRKELDAIRDSYRLAYLISELN